MVKLFFYLAPSTYNFLFYYCQAFRTVWPDVIKSSAIFPKVTQKSALVIFT